MGEGAVPIRDEAVVVCPVCRGPARFLRAWCLPVRDPGEMAWFKGARDFSLLRDPGTGETWVCHRRRLGAAAPEEMPGLPEYYRMNLRHGVAPGVLAGEGTLLCDGCGTARAGRIAWPEDAWYQITYRGAVLWAWDRATALALLDHVAGTDRHLRDDHPHVRFLRRVPSVFLTAGARGPVTERLRRILKEGRR